MKILLLTDDMLIGGVPRHVTDLANGLAVRGHHVIVAASDGPSRHHLIPKVRFVPLRLVRNGTARKNWLGSLAALPKLIELAEREEIDVIHSHKRYSDLLARAVASASRRPHVSTCHNTFGNLRRLSVFGSHTIACSESIKAMLVRQYGKQESAVKVVYVGTKGLARASVDMQARMRSQLKLSTQVRVFCSVGHLSKAKDRMTLLLALTTLHSQHSLENIVCLIVGDGEEEDDLKRYVRDHDLEKNVLFLPGSTDIGSIFNISEFGVLSSVQEGLPYVLLEAGSLAKPHVATDVGGVSEFVESGVTGLLVPPRNPEAMAIAIRSMIELAEKTKDLGMNALKKWQVQHSYDSFVDSVIKVYEQSMHERK